MTYYPIQIDSLSPREQVIDAINRLYIGLDDVNMDLVESAIVHSEEVSIKMGDKVTKGWGNLREHLLKNVIPVSTTHQLTNFRVIFDSETSARLTAHCVAHHLNEGKGYNAVGGLFEVDLVYEEADDLWKILHLTMKIKWNN